MIQANELRIGVYVYEKQKGVIQIQSGHDIEEIEDWLGDTDYYTAIPINEEWLLKFGWKLYGLLGCQFYMTDGNIELVSRKDGSISMEIEGQLLPLDHIKYVHQLQNLWMGLTGKELEVKP